MSGATIHARELRRSYEQAGVDALRGVDLDIAAAEFVAITGPSGSGKSTLLHVLGGLDVDFEGAVMVQGVDLRRLPDPSAFRARVVGFVFQSFHLLPTLTAVENVQIPMFGQFRSRQARAQHAADLLDLVGLADRRHHLPAQLSGGERQRVAIARSLANEPQLLLADEPTGNLDTANAANILDVLGQLHARTQITIVLVTHDPAVAGRAHRRIAMLDGRVVDAPRSTGN